jgi:hypothetical protein
MLPLRQTQRGSTQELCCCSVHMGQSHPERLLLMVGCTRQMLVVAATCHALGRLLVTRSALTCPLTVHRQARHTDPVVLVSRLNMGLLYAALRCRFASLRCLRVSWRTCASASRTASTASTSSTRPSAWRSTTTCSQVSAALLLVGWPGMIPAAASMLVSTGQHKFCTEWITVVEQKRM